MISETIRRFTILILLGAASVVGFPSTGNGGDSTSGKVIPLHEADANAVSVLGEGVVEKALPAAPIADTARLMPLRFGKWTYGVLAGEHKNTHQEDTIGKARHKKSGVLWRRVVGKKSIEYFRVNSGGSIELVSEVDVTEGVITRYTPALSVMFNGMKPGEKKTVETKVRVYDLHDPAFEKYRGHLKVTYTYIGAYEVTVPAGKFSTTLIKSSYKGKVGPASVTDGGYVFYAENVGIVAAVERLHVTAFLFYDKRTKTPKILIHKDG